MAKGLDILFVYPPTGWTKDAMSIAENDAPPLGLLYLAAAARNAGFLVSVVDMNHPCLDAVGLASIMEQQRPRIVAFSVLTPTSRQVKHLAQMVKAHFADTYVVAGGVHATALPSDLLDAGVDFVIAGEGETTFVELANALLSGRDPAGVAGLVYLEAQQAARNGRDQRGQGHTIVASKRDSHRNLDALPLPARDLVPILDYGQPGALCTSRGCPHSCSFCSSVLSGGHTYRLRAIDCVMDEIAIMHEQFGITRFQFLDDNFAAVPERARALVARLAGRGYVWSCQTSVMELAGHTDLLGHMHEAGCCEVYFGLESGSRRILSQYMSIDPDQAMTVLAEAASFGTRNGHSSENALQTVVGFMVGHPEDDADTIEETFAFALQLRRMGIDTMCSIMQPYPGSMIFSDPQHYGLVIANRNYQDYRYPQANMSTRRLSRDAISRLYAGGLLRLLRTY